MKKPNIVSVFADEWPAYATGYAGDPNCKTPVLDRQGDEFLDGRRYLERDGLTHYGEVKYGVSKPWVDPWQPT